MGFAVWRTLPNLRRVLVALFLVWPHAAQAQQADEFGRQIVDIANRYTAAIMAAKLCRRYEFRDETQEADFSSNRELSRIYASRIFIEAFPGKPRQALAAQLERMDRDLEAKIKGFHADAGCSHELVEVFLKWFEELKKFPRMPYPQPAISDDGFRTMANRWLKLNSRLQ